MHRFKKLDVDKCNPSSSNDCIDVNPPTPILEQSKKQKLNPKFLPSMDGIFRSVFGIWSTPPKEVNDSATNHHQISSLAPVSVQNLSVSCDNVESSNTTSNHPDSAHSIDSKSDCNDIFFTPEQFPDSDDENNFDENENNRNVNSRTSTASSITDSTNVVSKAEENCFMRSTNDVVNRDNEEKAHHQMTTLPITTQSSYNKSASLNLRPFAIGRTYSPMRSLPPEPVLRPIRKPNSDSLSIMMKNFRKMEIDSTSVGNGTADSVPPPTKKDQTKSDIVDGIDGQALKTNLK